MEGYGGSFSPDDPLTRGQMAKILFNTLGLTETAENPFTDVPAGEEAIEVEVNAGDATVAAEDESKVTVTGSTAETVKKHERKWDAGEVTTEPTCSKEGVRTCACTVEGCPTGTKTETIEK